ncbi:MAG: protein tyrosine phosphatase family protein [Acidobacteriota bacterium]
MNSYSCWLSVFFLLSSYVAGDEQGQVSARNFLRINEEFCTAGQPSLQDLERLKAQGVIGIINLRRPEENAAEQAEEKQKAQELGLKYFSIPVDGANPLPEQAEEFLEIVSEKENRPLFIHCLSANRVGAFWFIYRVLHDGWDCAKAEQEAREVGLSRPNLVEFARKYVQEKKPQACAAGLQDD